MADLHPLLIDKRIVERNIAKGLVTRKDYDKHLADLPDRSNDGEWVEFEPPEEGSSGHDPQSE
jgi:hypothetical protein